MAILAGDTLFSKAFETVLETPIDSISYERVLNALKQLLMHVSRYVRVKHLTCVLRVISK